MPDDDLETGEVEVTDGNPAWASVLEKIPSQFHSDLRPALEQWDKGVQERFQKVHSDYEGWRPFKENGIQPEQVNTALGFVSALEQNPKEVLEALQTFYRQQGIIQDAANGVNNGFNNQQQGQQAANQQGDGEPDAYAAKIAALEQQSTTLAQVLLKQQQEAMAKQEDARLDQELNRVKKVFETKTGLPFNERVVIGYAQGLGVDVETAAEHYANDLKGLLENQRPRVPAPNLLGSGGSLPSGQTSLRGKTPAELDSIALQVLQGINRSGQIPH